MMKLFLLFNETATTEIYTYGHTLSLHVALPISATTRSGTDPPDCVVTGRFWIVDNRSRALSESATRIGIRSEEHTSELQSLMRTSYAVFCSKNKKTNKVSHSITLCQQQHSETHPLILSSSHPLILH